MEQEAAAEEGGGAKAESSGMPEHPGRDSDSEGSGQEEEGEGEEK